MINLTIENNFIHLGGGGVKQSDVVEVHTCTCFIHPVSVNLLVSAFNPFTFMVIINMYGPITVFLIVFGLFSIGLFLLLCFLPREVPLAFVVKLNWQKFS